MCNPNESIRFAPEPETVAPGEIQWRGLEWAFDAVDVGLVFLDAAGQLVFANLAARRIAAERDGLKLSLSGLATADAASTRKLLEMVCQLAFRRAAEPLRMRVDRMSCDRPLLLTLIRIPSTDLLDAFAFKAVVAVFIRDVGADPRVNRELLVAAFDLTGREGEIAILLGQGADLQSIAQTLRIGLGTVRSHLKRVFHKTGTRSQMTLAMLVREFADPFDLGQLRDDPSAG